MPPDAHAAKRLGGRVLRAVLDAGRGGLLVNLRNVPWPKLLGNRAAPDELNIAAHVHLRKRRRYNDQTQEQRKTRSHGRLS